MMRTTSILPAVLALLAALALGACSSSDASSSANLVPVEGTVPATVADPTAAPAAATGAVPATAPVDNRDEFDQVINAYDSFLSLRAQAITNDLPLADLASVATPLAIEQVLNLRTENEQLAAQDSYAVLSDLNEWSNVTAIGKADDRLLFTDCTERHYVTPGGFTVVRFVQNDVTVVQADGTYKVDDVQVTQNGVVLETPGEFGCVPPSFAERAESVARRAVETAADLIADPTAALSSELPPIFAEGARVDLNGALEGLVDLGYSRNADETITYRVLGMDVHRPEFTVAVAVCRTFPTGRSYVDNAGNATVPDLPSGATTLEWIYVNLEPVPSGAESDDVVIAVEDRGLSCERG